MSRFMETQITIRMRWAHVENEYGESYSIPAEDYNAADHPGTVTYSKGYGVRESAPGYMDCTEWEVFEALEEAEARYKEIEDEYDEMDEESA